MKNLASILELSKAVRDFKGCCEENKSQKIVGATIGEKALLLSQVKSGIYVSDDPLIFSNLSEALSSFGFKVGKILTVDENLFLSNIQDNQLTFALLKNIYDMLLEKVDFLVCSPIVLMQKLPSKNQFLQSYISIRLNQNFGYQNFISNLVKLGYKRCDKVESEGEFSARGDIIDIYGPQYENIIRISFFDEEIESISLLDSDLKVSSALEEFDFYPLNIASIINVDENQIKKVIIEESNNSKLQGSELLNKENLVSLALEKISKNEYSQFFNAFFNLENNIFSIFNDKKIIIDEPKKISDTARFLYKSNALSIFDLINKGELFNAHLSHFIEDNVIFKNVITNNLIVFQNVNDNSFEYSKVINLKIIGSQKYVFDFQLLKKDLDIYKLNHKVVLFCGNRNNKKILEDFLLEKGFLFHSLEDDFNINGNIFTSIVNMPKSASFLDGNIIFIGVDDLFKKSTYKAKENKKGVFYLPKVGDYVVHSLHGIGKCIGLEKLKLTGSEKDYFIIEYAGGDIFYLPSEQANLISSYSGSDKEPKLNKIGGQEFSKLKERVKNSVQGLAIDLLKLYSEREKLRGFSYSKDGYLMQAFEDAFEFTETQDQLTAIHDIKKDMEDGKVMDRLVCGDVGFGKTEVALRAMYKAVIDGKQVAFLCPTSILSEQHYLTCKKRFKDFMVNVAVLNRLKPKNVQTQIIKDIKDGKVNIICGTHRLLSSDIEFQDLGLLVLDEEQRFGVADKEKIKNLKKQVNVLSLSATPIPRTLHMSLTGIRDISIIETPPKDRLPVQTYVNEFSFNLLIDACKRELARDGQVLIVYNRVETINNFAGQLKDALPEVKIGVAHGQMNEKQLEDSILKLYNQEYKILVSTTLIENGVDLPLANTLFVVEADKLGLSQLYQLRGRIGRSNRLAYAYFTYDENKPLTEDAYKRLSALMEYTELGSGFKIAMRDLEIRGAGNVLGKQQHGHMEKVGYDMYSKLLKESIEELKGEKKKEKLPIKLDIDIPAYIDNSYIYDEEQRIKIYNEISEVSSLSDFESLKSQLTDAFGEMSKETENIIKIGLIKNLAQYMGAKRIIVNKNVFEIQLYKSEDIINQQIADCLNKYKDVCVLKFEDLPIIKFNITSQEVSVKVEKLISFLVDAYF